MSAFGMRSNDPRCLAVLLLAAAIVTAPARAQKRELTFSPGGIPGQTRSFQSSAGGVHISADRSFRINYGHRFVSAEIAALYGEIQFVAIPNRSLTAASAVVPQNYASLYLTPGLRLKFFPSSRLSRWVAIGGGYALYEQSDRLSNGQKNNQQVLKPRRFGFRWERCAISCPATQI
jgi:hypothetical protein